LLGQNTLKRQNWSKIDQNIYFPPKKGDFFAKRNNKLFTNAFKVLFYSIANIKACLTSHK